MKCAATKKIPNIRVRITSSIQTWFLPPPKERNSRRGGDNFIMSPAYCGSNATGWRKTKEYMGGEVTIASAMAISGAAVNPDAGCGGEGVTRQPFLSILMGMLNLRLGYWVPNPNPHESEGAIRPSRAELISGPVCGKLIFRYR